MSDRRALGAATLGVCSLGVALAQQHNPSGDYLAVPPFLCQSSGGAAALISAYGSGAGAVYQASFQRTMINGRYQVNWAGDLRGLFLDAAGLLREDNGGEIFSAGAWLRDLTDVANQRSYASVSGARYIITALDGGDGSAPDGLIDADEQTPFVASAFNDAKAGLLQAADAGEAGRIVDYIRGEDQAGFRSRRIAAAKTWRLGDVIHSVPALAGRPAENYDLIYKDESYNRFIKTYRNRRTVVYVGANDGMLHAFNAGWLDPASKQFKKGAPGATRYDLGAELWAYVPYNLLAHLKYLTRPEYGRRSGDHVYYVDQTPRIFDARIFTPAVAGGVRGQAGVEHTDGWGTLLVGAMGFGGGEIEVDVDIGNPGADLRTLRSAIFILDITDPDAPPKLLLEFSHEGLGFTTAMPTPVVMDGGSASGSWYLMLGSGPDADRVGLRQGESTQAARLFLIDLKTMSLENRFGASGSGIRQLPDAGSFISAMTTVDYDLDFRADAVYFGTVAGTERRWSGKLYRVAMRNSANEYVAEPSWRPSVLYNAARPITAKPSIGLDRRRNRWVLVGTGRLLTQEDIGDRSVQHFYGVKETRVLSPGDDFGRFNWRQAPVDGLVDISAVGVKNSGLLINPPELNPALPQPPRLQDLEKRMTQLSDSGAYLHGWKRSFAPGARVIEEAALFGGALSHTTFRPSAAGCAGESVAELFAVNFSTGAAGPESIVKVSNLTAGDDALDIALDIGNAPAPSLHTGGDDRNDGQTIVFIQTANGRIIPIRQRNLHSVRGGEMSWRVLR